MNLHLLPNINTINLSKRCGYNINMKLEDFLEELTNTKVHSFMRTVISWKNGDNNAFKKIGESAEIIYTPYLKVKVSKIPLDVLKNIWSTIYTDGKKMYIYKNCCR